MAGESNTEIVVTLIICVGVWIFAIIYSPLARMLVAGAGLIGLGFLLTKIRQPTPKILAWTTLTLWGAGGLLVGIAVIQWAIWYMGFRVGY
jgi:hypothetical protein